MIESEVKRQRLTEIVANWCDFTKISLYLRQQDIPNLVSQVVDEFYKVSFCCGHRGHWDDGVAIAFKDYIDGKMGEVQGTYCKDCAEKYIDTFGAWEIKV